MNQKPGVMIYFDLLPAIENLTAADCGNLLRAMLEYGSKKTIPPLTKRVGLLWPMIQMRLDRDEMQYCNVVTKRAYSAYVRWAKYHGEEPMDFTAWQEKKGYALINETYEPSTGCFIRDA